MLLILHVVMKTLDKTCCHVYIYPKCLYDNITTLGRIMDKEQALDQIPDPYFCIECNSESDKSDLVEMEIGRVGQIVFGCPHCGAVVVPV